MGALLRETSELHFGKPQLARCQGAGTPHLNARILYRASGQRRVGGGLVSVIRSVAAGLSEKIPRDGARHERIGGECRPDTVCRPIARGSSSHPRKTCARLRRGRPRLAPGCGALPTWTSAIRWDPISRRAEEGGAKSQSYRAGWPGALSRALFRPDASYSVKSRGAPNFPQEQRGARGDPALCRERADRVAAWPVLAERVPPAASRIRLRRISCCRCSPSLGRLGPVQTVAEGAGGRGDHAVVQDQPGAHGFVIAREGRGPVAGVLHGVLLWRGVKVLFGNASIGEAKCHSKAS